MACERIPSLTLAFPIVTGAVIAVDEADADAADAAAFSATAAPCYYDPSPTGGYGDVGGIGYYCDGVQSLEGMNPLNAAQIPIDGVLVMQASYLGTWGQPLAARAIVTVTLDDVEVEGDLDAAPAPGLLVWRPAAAWTAGAYHFNAIVNNPGLPDGCGQDMFLVDFDLTVTADASAAITPSTLTGTESVNITPIVSLETLVCCPGVAPTLYQDMCSGSSTVQFDPAQCAPTRADGTLLVDLMGTASATGPTAQQIYYDLNIDGAYYQTSLTPAFSVGLQKPFCATVTTHDVASGDSVTGPMACFGSDAAGTLGPHEIAPPDSFTCSLRTCEIADNTWDLDACTPLDPDHPNEPEPDTSKGCDCSADDANAPATLALAGVVGLLLRRRSRR